MSILTEKDKKDGEKLAIMINALSDKKKLFLLGYSQALVDSESIPGIKEVKEERTKK